MKSFFFRHLHIVLLASAMATFACSGFAQPSAKNSATRKIVPPPSADLSYTIKANQKGLALDGTAIVHWSANAQQYVVSTESRAMLLGKILEAKSEGGIDGFGLAPNTATEKRFRKDLTTTTFDRAAKTITFSASGNTYPIKGGEQDRNSAIWQLASLGRAGQIKPGNTIQMVVAGQKDADTWTFKVAKQEKIATALGSLNTLRISKVIKDGDNEQKVDIWLAPGKEWYPVQLRFTEPNGDFIEQTVETISPKS
jgi:hypothetical protein